MNRGPAVTEGSLQRHSGNDGVPLGKIQICNASITLCPTDRQVISYLAEGLNPEQRRRIEEHFIRCVWCRKIRRTPIIICNAPITLCLTHTLVQSYLAGRLRPEQRQQIEQHLVDCIWCREKFISTIHILSAPCPGSSLLEAGEKAAASARRLSSSDKRERAPSGDSQRRETTAGSIISIIKETWHKITQHEN